MGISAIELAQSRSLGIRGEAYPRRHLLSRNAAGCYTDLLLKARELFAGGQWHPVFAIPGQTNDC
jgi:hypothetical protein